MIAAMLGILDPGDEVVVFEPFKNIVPTRTRTMVPDDHGATLVDLLRPAG